MESEGEGESQDPKRPLSSSDGTSSLWDGAESARDREVMCAKDVPSVNLALPPVGWQRTLPHAAQRTTVCACEKTVVMAKQPEYPSLT